MAIPVRSDGTATRPSAVRAVVERLRDRILAGELAAGTPLREIALADALDVSRGTLREALRTATAEGLVVHVAHRGAEVRRLTAGDVRDCFRVRALVEGAAVAGAATVADDRRRAVAAAFAAYRVVAGSGDWRRLIEADLELHAALVGGLASPRLDRLFAGIAGELRLAFAMESHADGEADDPRRLRSEHAAIVGPFVAGDGAAAAEALRGHLARHEERVLELVGGAGVQPGA